jgi:hypothetical protein
MKPRISILDNAFTYRPSYATAIVDTWRRFGWRPPEHDARKWQAQPRAQEPRRWRTEQAANRGAST